MKTTYIEPRAVELSLYEDEHLRLLAIMLKRPSKDLVRALLRKGLNELQVQLNNTSTDEQRQSIVQQLLRN